MTAAPQLSRLALLGALLLLLPAAALAQLYTTTPGIGAVAPEGTGFLLHVESVDDAARRVVMKVRDPGGIGFDEAGEVEIREHGVTGGAVASWAYGAGVTGFEVAVPLDFTSGSKRYYAVAADAAADGAVTDDEWTGPVEVRYAAADSVPLVRNVTGRQDEGRRTVTVRYDLYDADDSALRVTLEASADGGATWDVPVATVDGDVGSDVRPGPGRQIVWDAGKDWPDRQTETMRFRVTAVEVESDITAIQRIAAGRDHSIYVKSDGSLWAMGLNGYGQLGDGGLTDRHTPVLVGQSVWQVSANEFTSYFVKENKSFWAAGWNKYGQLGDGTTRNRSNPVQIATSVCQSAAGEEYGLFVDSDGGSWAMGRNHWGQLGDGTQIEHHTPVRVAANVHQVAAGVAHSLFLKDDGSLWAVGSNRYGQLGDGTTVFRSIPIQVASNVRQIAAGYSHSLFVKDDGSLWAMGGNQAGQLGDETNTDRHSPVQVSSNVSQLAAG